MSTVMPTKTVELHGKVYQILLISSKETEQNFVFRVVIFLSTDRKWLIYRCPAKTLVRSWVYHFSFEWVHWRTFVTFREDSMHKFTANSSGVFFRSKNYKIIFISTFLNFFLMWTSLTSSAVCLLAWTFHSLGKLNNLRFSTATGVVSHCHSHCHWVISCVNTKNLAGSAFFGSAPEPADPLSTKRHVPTVFRKLPC